MAEYFREDEGYDEEQVELDVEVIPHSTNELACLHDGGECWGEFAALFEEAAGVGAIWRRSLLLFRQAPGGPFGPARMA